MLLIAASIARVIGELFLKTQALSATTTSGPDPTLQPSPCNRGDLPVCPLLANAPATEDFFKLFIFFAEQRRSILSYRLLQGCS